VCAAVGSDLSRSLESADPLSQITVLARHTPPLARATSNDATELFAQLQQLAERVALPGVDGARLLAVWAQASANPSVD
jgi:hypothetical protein